MCQTTPPRSSGFFAVRAMCRIGDGAVLLGEDLVALLGVAELAAASSCGSLRGVQTPSVAVAVVGR